LVSHSRTPRLLVTVSRAAKAPAAPTARTLTKLFMRALELAQQSRRLQRICAKRWVVDVHIVTDAHIASLNTRHLKVRGPTDVLAFTMGELDPERRALNLGEIVVSFETARREAGKRGIAIEEELGRYCLHGFLHLLGHEDNSRTARQAMFLVQEKALGLPRRTSARNPLDWGG